MIINFFFENKSGCFLRTFKFLALGFGDMKIQWGLFIRRCRQSQSINRVHPYRSGNPAIKAVKPYNLNAAEKMHPNIIDLARGPVQANYARQKSELVGARYRRSRVIGHEMLLSRSPG